MSNALQKLLLATGLVVGGFSLYIIAPTSTPTEVKNLALAEGCVARAAEAEFTVNAAGRLWLADAGIAVPQYVRLQFPVGICAGSNDAILPDLPFKKLSLLRLEDITTTPCADRPGVCTLWGNDRPFKVAVHQCAWKPNAGAACTKTDGGNPGVENTMRPGTYVGAGCVKKSCVEMAGESSRP